MFYCMTDSLDCVMLRVPLHFRCPEMLGKLINGLINWLEWFIYNKGITLQVTMKIMLVFNKMIQNLPFIRCYQELVIRRKKYEMSEVVHFNSLTNFSR